MTILYNLRHNVGVMRDEITKNVFYVLDQISMEHFNHFKPYKLPFLPPSLGPYTLKNLFYYINVAIFKTNGGSWKQQYHALIQNKTFWHFNFEIQRNGCEPNYVVIL